MKKRYLIPIAVLILCAGLFLWLLNADGICIGRIENQTDDQWSQLHVYMNDEITVDFPVEGEERVCLFQYETGRGSFSVKITDEEGKTVYRNTSNESGSASFLASSDLKVTINANGHGGVFSLLQREKPVLHAGEHLPTYGIQESGSHTGGRFTASYDLRKADGKYLNFYVENKGVGPVVISINGEYDQTIEPGHGGHISASISALIMPQTMTLNCESTSDEEIDIFWSIAQRRKK